MRNTLTVILLIAATSMAWGGITTYTFTSAQWASKIGTTPCDTATDGWRSIRDAIDFSTSYQLGAKVTAAASGAGAESIQSFSNVRRVTFNFATTTSGRGTIHLEVGPWQKDTAVHIATTNEDLVIVLPTEISGQIRFTVNCTRNSIWINSISIRSDNGQNPVFTEAHYRLVTHENQLRDSDQIMIGVPSANVLMGYFDETISHNNIHSIPGTYLEGGTEVKADDRAIYTLRQTMLNGTPCWYIQDEIRYEWAFLVANGGSTKNRLALWTDIVSPVYGNFGYWNITIATDGTACMENLGTSTGKYLQYNAGNTPTLFACYAGSTQTAVSVYRCEEAIGNIPAIVAPAVVFSAVPAGSPDGSRTITVNANLLSADISATLSNGSIFSLSTSTIDRDGDELTIRYTATEAGHYLDTLILTSGAVRTIVPVMLTILPVCTIDEAVHQPDNTTLYLGDVIVTKKYDQYIFVRDATGSMLVYDNGDGKGGRWAKGIEAGQTLSGVHGKTINYYGVPELGLGGSFSASAPGEVEPEVVTSLDSADVCRYVRIEGATITNRSITLGGKTIPVDADRFNVGSSEGVVADIDAIVMISHDELQLWLVKQHLSTGINVLTTESATRAWDLLGRPVTPETRGIIIRSDRTKICH